MDKLKDLQSYSLSRYRDWKGLFADIIQVGGGVVHPISKKNKK